MLSDPSILDVMATLAFVLGLVGQVSLFAFPRDRRVLERVLAVLFTVMVGGGVGLAWRAEQLRDADRAFTVLQFDRLRQAIAAHPAVSYQVYWAQGDAEAQALAQRIADAIKAGSGRPPVAELAVPTAMRGLVLGARDRRVGAGLAVDPVGRALMAARIATISDDVADLGPDTLRVTVGRKP